MKVRTVTQVLLLGVGWLVVAAGCFGSAGDKWTQARPKVVPVTGTILYQGKPVANASVTFAVEGAQAESKHGAFGTTDEEGRFQLMTFEANDGAVPGTYKVQVIKNEYLPSQAEQEGITDYDLSEYFANPAKFQRKKAPQLPKEYSTAKTTPLSAEVVDGAENDFTFELKK